MLICSGGYEGVAAVGSTIVAAPNCACELAVYNLDTGVLLRVDTRAFHERPEKGDCCNGFAGVAVVDDVVALAPYDSDHMLLYNVTSGMLMGFDVTGIASGNRKYGGIASWMHLVVAAPSLAEKLLVFNSRTHKLLGVDIAQAARQSTLNWKSRNPTFKGIVSVGSKFYLAPGSARAIAVFDASAFAPATASLHFKAFAFGMSTIASLMLLPRFLRMLVKSADAWRALYGLITLAILPLADNLLLVTSIWLFREGSLTVASVIIFACYLVPALLLAFLMITSGAPRGDAVLAFLHLLPLRRFAQGLRAGDLEGPLADRSFQLAILGAGILKKLPRATMLLMYAMWLLSDPSRYLLRSSCLVGSEQACASQLQGISHSAQQVSRSTGLSCKVL